MKENLSNIKASLKEQTCQKFNQIALQLIDKN